MSSDADTKISIVFKDLARGLDKKLEKIAGERMGFMIATFPMERTGHANYISNCLRSDTIQALKKLLINLENQSIDIPLRKKN